MPYDRHSPPDRNRPIPDASPHARHMAAAKPLRIPVSARQMAIAQTIVEECRMPRRGREPSVPALRTKTAKGAAATPLRDIALPGRIESGRQRPIRHKKSPCAAVHAPANRPFRPLHEPSTHPADATLRRIETDRKEASYRQVALKRPAAYTLSFFCIPLHGEQSRAVRQWKDLAACKPRKKIAKEALRFSLGAPAGVRYLYNSQ